MLDFPASYVSLPECNELDFNPQRNEQIKQLLFVFVSQRF